MMNTSYEHAVIIQNEFVIMGPIDVNMCVLRLVIEQ